MSSETPKGFLEALASEPLKNAERWAAVVWWYSKRGLPETATVRQICTDVEAAGYGRQNATRVSQTLRKDRRLTRSKNGAFAVKITALAALDAALAHFESVRREPTSGSPLAEIRSQAAERRTHDSPTIKPSLFIGSSSEGLRTARALEKQLERHAEITIWKDGVFGLGSGTLETLVDQLSNYDFAALVLTPDDLIESRREMSESPRDNVIFELGLFIGRLGRHRTFAVYNRDEKLKLPSDLAGVTCATYGNRSDGNYHAQMSPPSTQILDAIEKLGKVPRSLIPITLNERRTSRT